MMPKKRIQHFFNGEPVDVMPCFSGMGMVTMQAIHQMGIRFAEVHSSAEYMAASALKTAEIFGFDSVVIPYDMCTIPEALGRGVNFYQDSEDILYPTVTSKWATLDEVDLFTDYMSKGRMPVVDEALGLLKDQVNGRYAIGGWVLGPFTLAGQLLELNALLKGVKKDRDKFKDFLSKMTDLVIEVAMHYQDLGVDYMTIREMASSTDIVSPRMWKTIVQPNLQKVLEALKSPKILHICGSTDLIIEMMNECGADALSVGQKNNVLESRSKLGDDAIILGNFDPYGTLVQMDTADVEEVIKKSTDVVSAVWPGCDIWPDVKKENMEAYIGAVRKYGKSAGK